MSEFGTPNNKVIEEIQLLQAYEQGPLGMVMAYNLNHLKRFAGYSIPQYKDVEEISTRTNENDNTHMTEDIGSGFVEFGSVYGPYDMTSLMIANPKNITQEEYDSLSEEERAEFGITYNGTAVIGEKLPEDVEKMFKDINHFIEAEKVRDDSHEPGGDRDGMKLYKGKLDGAVIYTEETWATFIIGGREYTARSLFALGEESGAVALDSLSLHDLDRIEEAGGSRFQARKDVTRKTLESFIAHIRQIKNIE